MKCFYCGKAILASDKKTMLGFEKPYVNVYVHNDGCYPEIKGIGENEYMNANSERLYELSTASPTAMYKKENVKRK